MYRRNFYIFTKEEFQFDSSAYNLVLQALSIKEDVHRVGASKENSVEVPAFLA